MSVTILIGDALKRLRELPDASVHCVITSPPYWGLRAYGGQPGMIGLEDTFEEHLANLLAVFAEVWRVLRSDGTVWLNYGDAYYGGGNGGYTNYTHGPGMHSPVEGLREGPRESMPGLKPKDLMLMPARVAIALQEAGWWVRSEVIWHKLNPMPASVKDRPTCAHEKVWMLTKARRYFWDAEAVRIPVTGGAHPRRKDGERLPAKGTEPNDRRTGTWKEKMPDGWDTGPGAHGTIHRKGREKGKTPRAQPPRHEQYGPGHKSLDDAPRGFGANLRNVISLATQPFPEAHFATFPPDIVRPWVLSERANGASARSAAPPGIDGRRASAWTNPGRRRAARSRSPSSKV